MPDPISATAGVLVEGDARSRASGAGLRVRSRALAGAASPVGIGETRDAGHPRNPQLGRARSDVSSPLVAGPGVQPGLARHNRAYVARGATDQRLDRCSPI